MLDWSLVLLLLFLGFTLFLLLTFLILIFLTLLVILLLLFSYFLKDYYLLYSLLVLLKFILIRVNNNLTFYLFNFSLRLSIFQRFWPQQKKQSKSNLESLRIDKILLTIDHKRACWKTHSRRSCFRYLIGIDPVYLSHQSLIPSLAMCKSYNCSLLD